MFPPAKEVGRYLKSYQKRYIPDEMVKLGCEVTSVVREEDGGRWRVEWRDKGRSEPEVEVFDFLAVCSGFFSTPYIPPIDGLENFNGRVLHSMEYALSKFELSGKKKVVVVGGSISGAEVAADLALRVSSLQAEKVEIVHLIQRPFWILPKYLPVPNSGDATAPRFLPGDFVLYDHNKRLEQVNQPPIAAEEGHMAVNNYLKAIIGHDQYDISPALHVSDKYMRQSPWVAITDSYAGFVRTGVIKPITGRLSEVPLTSPRTLVLEPGTPGSVAEEIREVDTIVLATGYHPTSSLQPMFSRSMFSSFTSSPSVPKDPNFLPFLLYNQILHPAFQRTGGFVGMHKGPYFGVMEMQGRWLAALFSGKVDWPTDEEMRKGIEASGKIRDSRADRNQSGFRPQWSSSDYLEVVGDLRGRLKMPFTPSATTYSPNPMIPAHFVDANSNNEANRMLSSLKAYITPPPSTGASFVAKAIFRSLQGKWAIFRRIDSKHPGFPSGQFTGSAEFRPRTPTFTPSPRSEEEPNSPGCSTRLVQDRNPPSSETPGGEILEYLYIEQGDFVTDTGSTMTGRRRYIYRYHPDEDVITVWFVKADGIDVDYFFHEASILGESEQENVLLDSVPEVDLKGGWKARGKHLCRLDWYWPSYRFVFQRGRADLEKFWIRYKVSGPHKDYTAEGRYQRV